MILQLGTKWNFPISIQNLLACRLRLLLYILIYSLLYEASFIMYNIWTKHVFPKFLEGKRVFVIKILKCKIGVYEFLSKIWQEPGLVLGSYKTVGWHVWSIECLVIRLKRVSYRNLNCTNTSNQIQTEGCRWVCTKKRKFRSQYITGISHGSESLILLRLHNISVSRMYIHHCRDGPSVTDSQLY